MSYELHEINTIVKMLKNLQGCCSVYAFSGTLGAGKTTIIKRLLETFGVQDPVVSPTFNYVNTYTVTAPTGDIYSFYHFDLYRLTKKEDFFNPGFDEYLYQPNSWSFIEWPELILSDISEHSCVISLTHASDTLRTATIEYTGPCFKDKF